MTISRLRDLRISLGITQLELAQEAGVSRHSVLRMEQLTYPTPLPNIIQALSDIEGTSERDLIAIYEADVKSNRAQAAELYFDDPLLQRECFITALRGTLSGTGSIHPFQTWRELLFERLGENSSRIHFCTVTSIHPATLDKYEAFKTGFPGAVELALKECGVVSDVLAAFKTESKFNRVLLHD